MWAGKDGSLTVIHHCRISYADNLVYCHAVSKRFEGSCHILLVYFFHLFGISLCHLKGKANEDLLA